MSKPLGIYEAIETKRIELNLAGEMEGLTSENVIKLSRELDLLINQFYSQKSAAM